MSKSLGNVIEPLELKNIYGLDAFRFFLIRDMTFGLDSNFSEDALVQRLNSDLANDLGNLFSRVLSMVHKYLQGVVPEVDPSAEHECELGLETDARSAVDGLEISNAADDSQVKTYYFKTPALNLEDKLPTVYVFAEDDKGNRSAPVAVQTAEALR